VGEDSTSAGFMIRDRREKRLKMGIAVTIFRFLLLATRHMPHLPAGHCGKAAIEFCRAKAHVA